MVGQIAKYYSVLPSEVLGTSLDDFFLNVEITSANIEYEQEKKTTKGKIETKRAWLGDFREQIKKRKKM